MARISVNGLDSLMDDLLTVAEIPDDVAEEMLDAEAAIVEEAQVYTAAAKPCDPLPTGK